MAGVLGSLVGSTVRIASDAAEEQALALTTSSSGTGPFNGTLHFPAPAKPQAGLSLPSGLLLEGGAPSSAAAQNGTPIAPLFVDCAWPWNQMWAGYLNAYVALPPSGPLTPALLGTTSWTIEISAASARTASQCAIGQNQLARISETVAGQAVAVLAGVPGSPVLNSGVRIDDGAMHSLCLMCVYSSTGPSTFLFAVDGTVTNVSTGTWAPGTAGAFIGNGYDGIWCGFLREARISSIARYGATASTSPGAVLFTPATTPFVQDASTVALYHLSGDASDSGSTPAPPAIGAISITTALGSDIIAYPVPVAGANPVQAVQLYRGTTRGSETLYSTNTGGGAGSFTVPTAPSAQCYWYYVVAVDAASAASAASNRVSSGLNGQGRNYQWAALLYYVPGPFPGTQAAYLQGLQDTTSTGLSPLGELYPGGSCTFEFWMNTTQSSGAGWIHIDARASIYVYVQDGCVVVRLPQLVLQPGAASLSTLIGAPFVADGNWHHVAITVQAGAQMGNASLLSLWIDGRLAAQATGVFAPGSRKEQLGAVLLNAYTGFLAELSVTSMAQYSAPFTPPSAPFLHRRADQIMLLHLNGSVADSNGQADPPYPPIISVSAAGGNDNVRYSAAAGPAAVASYALYAGPTPGGEASTPVATNTGAAPGSFVQPSPAAGAARYYYVKALDVNGLASAPSNEVWVPAAGATVYPDNPALLYSPGTWNITGSGTSAVAISNNPGAYIRTLFTGQRLALLFNTTKNVMPYPHVTVRIDGQVWVRQQIGATINVTPTLLPQNVIHLLEVEFDACSASSDRWNTPVEALYFTGLVLDAGQSVTAPPSRPKRVVLFGESNAEGYNTIPATVRYNNDFSDSAVLSYAQLLRDLLDMEAGVVAFAGQGITQSMYGNYGPNFQQAYGYCYKGVARSFSTIDAVLIFIGQGDAEALAGGRTTPAAIQAAMSSVLSGLLAANATMRIAVVRPLDNNPFSLYVSQAQAAIHAAVVTAASPRVYWIDTTGFLNPNTDLQPDHIHVLAAAHLGKLAPKLAAALQPVLYPA